MRALRDHGFITPRYLVLALRTGLDGPEPVLDRPLDGLVIAKLEMKERDIFGRPPVAAVKDVWPNEIERAGDRQPAAAGKEHQDLIAHPFGGEIKELAGE